MKLKNKISIIILFIWATMATLFYYGSQRIILESYSHLERQTLVDNIDRAQGALGQMIDSVEYSVKDWSIWDDSYKFAQDKNEQFIKSTMALSSFQSINMDIILFYDTSGKLIYSGAANSDRTQSIPVPKDLLDYLTPNNELVHHTDIQQTTKGLMSIPSGILLVASHSIINSEGKGPAHGTLIMARYLTGEVVEKLNQLTKLKVFLFRVPQTIGSASILSIYNSLIDRETDEIIASDTHLEGYRFLVDIHGKPIAILNIQYPRKIYQIGLEATRYANLTVFAYSIIITMMLWFLLQFLIVKRIERLSKHLNSTRTQDKIFSGAFGNMPDEVTSVVTLYHQASHDPLTGLANRSHLYKAFGHEVQHILNHDKKIVILYIDFDHFKRINDTMGRSAGDEALMVTAKRLASLLRDNDIAAHIGGDEFVIMLTDIEKDQIESIISKIFKNINRPFIFENHEVHVSTSMGVCVYPDDGNSIEQLIQRADVALNHAKEHGRRHYQFYSNSLNQTINEAHHKEIELQNALEQKQLCLYYQPIYNLRTKEIASLEALIRWNHPTKGLLTAAEIIPLAERTDLIYPIGDWILKTACAQIKEWQNKGLPVVPVAVNVSAAQMRQTSLSESILSALQESSLDPHLLEIEITETGLINITPELQKELEGLKASGIKLTIDDFGTGYAGLGYLKSLPVSKLKIDQSFIRDIQTDPDDKAITLAIIAIAHQLNLKVTAEGVENIEQYNFMCYHQVDEVQGFLLSHPLDPVTCEKILSGEKYLPDMDDVEPGSNS